MSKLTTIKAENIRLEEDHRLLKCPKCSYWNKARYQRIVDKIFIVTCKKCGAKYHPA